MDTTLTIRADDELRVELQRRASVEGKTVSEVVREILHRALAETPLETKVGHLRGRLARPVQDDTDPWHEEIRDHNWRS